MSGTPDHPRRNRALACAECKASKVKCVQSANADGKCQRCSRNGSPCLSRVRSSFTRTNKLRSRVEQLEQELSGLVSRLSDAPKQPPTTPDDERLGAVRLTTPPTCSIEPYPLSPTVRRNLFDRGVLSKEEAVTLCFSYRQMSARHWPYVIIPESFDLNSLIVERPTVLLAILATGSWQNRSLQLTQEQELLTNLSERLLFKGEKSIDILQGLLIYLGWYHFHIKPLSKQVYTLAAMAATLVIELGYNQPPKDFKANNNTSGTSIRVSGSDSWPIEARRVFVGCYTLCSLISVSHRKPNPLPYTDFVESCALSLLRDSQVPTDALLIDWVRIVRITEDINATFDYSNSSGEAPGLSEEKIKFCIREFEMLISKVSDNLTKQGFATLWCQVLRIYAHQISINVNTEDYSMYSSRIGLIFDCYIKATEYFDAVLKVPFQEMQCWSYTHWMQINYVVLLMGRLLVSVTSSAQWNSDAPVRLMNFSSCLELLSARLVDLILLTNSTSEQSSGFKQLLSVWDTVKSSVRNTLDCLASPVQQFGDQGATGQDLIPAPQNVSDNMYLADFGSFENGFENTFWIPSMLSQRNIL